MKKEMDLGAVTADTTGGEASPTSAGGTKASVDRGVHTRTRVVLTSAGAFLAIQVALALYTTALWQDAFARGAAGAVEPLAHRLVVTVVSGALAYSGLALAGHILAERGWGVASLLPLWVFVLAGAVVSPNHLPRPVGIGWAYACYSGCFGSPTMHSVIGAAVDLALISVPILWMRRLRRGGDSPLPRRDTVLPGAAAATLVLIVHRTAAAIEAPPRISDLVLAVGFGIALGSWRSRRWVGGAALMAAVPSAGSAGWVAGAILSPTPDFGPAQAIAAFTDTFVPMLALTVAAAAWGPVRALADWLKRSPMSLLIAANVLNIADAVFTHVAVTDGAARELNPVVRAMGIPAKIILVGAASMLIYRLRHRALVWPVVGLVLLLTYHLSGVVVAQ